MKKETDSAGTLARVLVEAQAKWAEERELLKARNDAMATLLRKMQADPGAFVVAYRARIVKALEGTHGQ